jgi:hypothetical protein
MSWKSYLCAGLLCALAVPAWATPEFRVSDSTFTGGFRVYQVQVRPDGPLLGNNPTTGGPGGSLAVEFSWAYGGGGPAVSSVTWDTGTWTDVPGNNPLTGTVTSGASLSGNEAFVSLGSIAFQPLNGDTNGDWFVDPADVSNLVPNWDPGHVNPQVTGGFADGDFNGDGYVDPADVSLMVPEWDPTHANDNGWQDFVEISKAATASPGGTWGGLTNAVGYDTVRVSQGGTNFDGITGAFAGGAGGGSAVPEPSSIMLALMGMLAMGLWRRRR